MSANVLHHDEVRRDLLPGAIGTGLKGWLRRGNGLVLMAVAGPGWLGLLSWEMPGPEQAASGGPALSHLVGKTPSLAADFLLQSFGIAAAILFAIPTFWAIDQLVRRPLHKPLRRLMLWPLAVLVAAGALSAAPAPASWPFARGLGGVVGDQIFGLVRAALAGLVPGYAALVAGSGLLVLAISLFIFTVRTGTAAVSSHEEHPSRGDVEFTFEPRNDLSESSIEFDNGDELAEQVDTPEPASSVRMAAPRRGQAPAFVRVSANPPEAADQSPVDAGDDDAMPMHVPYDDLPDEDADSRRIAQKFAPAAERRTAAEPVATDEPAPWIGWRALLNRAGEAVAPYKDSVVPEFDEDDEDQNPVQSPSAPTHARPHVEFATETVRTWPQAATAYRVPAVGLLELPEPKASRIVAGNDQLVARARRLEEVLDEFGVRCMIIGVLAGPIVTHFEIETAAGVKMARVVSLAEDIARALGVTTVRVAPVPGRNSIGIELPNEHREQVTLHELLDSPAYKRQGHVLPIAIGVGLDRQPIVSDLSLMTGLLIAGAPGSGKSMTLSAMLMSLLLRLSPDELRLVIVDPKTIDQTPFDGLAHLLTPVLSDPKQALVALQWCLAEMDERLKVMAKLNLRSIGMYNNAVRNALRQGTGFKRAVQTGFDRQTGRAIYEEESVTPKAMPHIVVVIDDLDALMQANGSACEAILQRLIRMSRQAGIHLIAATTRLDPELLSQRLLDAMTAKLCFKLASKAESRAMLGDGGGEVLLGAGDLLFSIGGVPVRGQAPKLGANDVRQVTDAIRRQAPAAYVPTIARAMNEPAPSADTEIYQQAVSLALHQGSMSLTDLRTKLGLGYVAANDLLKKMHVAGLVEAEDDASGRRRVLLGRAASA